MLPLTTQGATSPPAYADSDMVTVTDLKQMGYCPRIVYYHYCLPGIAAARTFKMEMGVEANQHTEAQEHRRSLRAYGLQDGERAYDVWLESAALGLRGRLDMLIRTREEMIPVDYKNSMDMSPKRGRERAQMRHNWQLQLAAYAVLLEQATGAVQPIHPIRRGFLYYIPVRRAYVVEISTELRSEVYAQLSRLREMIRREAMPDPTEVRGRCAACEFRRFCNDV
jgi:CRISPR-associated exonuclease Cas4